MWAVVKFSLSTVLYIFNVGSISEEYQYFGHYPSARLFVLVHLLKMEHNFSLP